MAAPRMFGLATRPVVDAVRSPTLPSTRLPFGRLAVPRNVRLWMMYSTWNVAPAAPVSGKIPFLLRLRPRNGAMKSSKTVMLIGVRNPMAQHVRLPRHPPASPMRFIPDPTLALV